MSWMSLRLENNAIQVSGVGDKQIYEKYKLESITVL